MFPFYLLIHFDLTSNVIICDEWVYGWSVHNLAVQHVVKFIAVKKYISSTPAHNHKLPPNISHFFFVVPYAHVY
jgi:hypothetical protein